MFTFKLTKASQLGEEDETYGATYWAEAEDTALPLRFNIKGRTVHDGSVITAEERTERQGKKLYYQLKKVKVLDSQAPVEPAVTSQTMAFNPPADLPKAPTNEVLDLLKEINGKLDKLLNLDAPDPEQAQAQAQATRDANLFSQKNYETVFGDEPLPTERDM